MNSKLFNFPNSHEFQLPEEHKASVAIIMRTKDRPILLVRALSSIICQRFSDWHLFLVNDGGDEQLLQETIIPYLPKFVGKFTFFTNPVSLGMEAASNIAARAIMDANNGKAVPNLPQTRRFAYAVVHDDNNSWHPDFLSETTAFLELPSNLRFGGVCTQTLAIEEKIIDETIQIVAESLFKPEVRSVLLQDLLIENKFPPIAFLYRVELFSKIGLYNEHLPVLGDWDFNLRVAAFADIGFLEKTLARHHSCYESAEGYKNSDIATNQVHRKTQELYKAAIIRETLIKNNELAGVFLFLSCIHQKIDELDARTREIYLFSDVKKVLYEKFFKHFFRLFNLPSSPPGKKKNFFKRLDSFVYQVFFKHVFHGKKK